MASLTGKRVLVTRPRSQAADFCRELEARGALAVPFPTIQIAPPEDVRPLDRAVAGLEAYQWVIFTSANGVASFWERMQAVGKDAAAFAGVQVAAIGPATAQALVQRGIRPRLVPDEFVAEAIAAQIGDVQGQRILLPRADIARKALPRALRALGAQVDEVVAYRTLPAVPEERALAEVRAGIDAITFTSSSTVRGFFQILGEEASQITSQAVIACIGPITAQTVRENGLTVDLVAGEYTAAGLAASLERYYSDHDG